MPIVIYRLYLAEIFSFMRTLFTALILLLFSFAAYSQDTITFLSGRTIEGEISSIDEGQVKYLHVKKSKKVERFVDMYELFSIKYANGKEEIYYKQDTATGYYFTQDEMQHYIWGRQDAGKYFKAPLNTLSSFALSATGGYFLAGSFLIFPVPFLTTLGPAAPKVKIKPENTRNPELVKQPAYIMGYEKRAKGKKINNGLKGSLLGIATGVAIAIITSSGGAE